MKQHTVLISGAGVAGPTLAYWLSRYGFRPTVVERSAGQRSSGNPVDVRGEAMDVADRTGGIARLAAAAMCFGAPSTALHQAAAGVDVTFAAGGPRRFDLVVGADGLHSGVRRLV